MTVAFAASMISGLAEDGSLSSEKSFLEENGPEFFLSCSSDLSGVGPLGLSGLAAISDQGVATAGVGGRGNEDMDNNRK